jgi:hypothetical protein
LTPKKVTETIYVNVNKFKNILIFRLAEIRRLIFSIYSKSGELGTFFFTKILRIRRNHIFQVEKMRKFRTPFRPSDQNLDDWGMLSGRSEWTHAIGLLLCLQYKYCIVALRQRVRSSFEFVFSPIATPLDCRCNL